MQKSPVAVLTPPSSAKSPSFSIDRPEVAAAKALLLNLKCQSMVGPVRTTQDEGKPKTFTFTEEELMNIFTSFRNSNNSSKASNDSEDEDTESTEDTDSDSEPERRRKTTSKKTSKGKKAGRYETGSFSGNKNNSRSFNTGGGGTSSKPSMKAKGPTHSNNEYNHDSFNTTSSGGSTPGIAPFLYGMPFGIPGMPTFSGDSWSYAEQGSSGKGKRSKKYYC